MANTMAYEIGTESTYIAQLNPMEQKILKIASEHLETSFSLKKSIGFQEWQEAQKAQKAQAEQPKQSEQQIQSELKQAQDQAQDQTQEPKVQPKKPLIKRKIKIKSIPS
jgi:hypothetical protein